MIDNLVSICCGVHIFNPCPFPSSNKTSWRRRGDVVATSLCTSQRCRRYVSNETPNDVSMVHRQDVSVVRVHNVLLEYRDDVSRGRSNNFPPVRLHDVSNRSKMKHPTTSQWYIAKMS